MGNTYSINKINYESMKKIINNSDSKFIVINTLKLDNQSCLISNTVSCEEEINVINDYICKNKNINIVIYGENSIDNTIITKYNQLQELGFNNLYVYIGGLFEWLLLQDIYGYDEFPTTSKTIELLKYRGKSLL
jgi:rhodanese-related sulfurtransferase|tara:strand:+ start:8988 stop:9389 length:402 start_codon:yes stop_codon:yes gene_type:complete